jgi:RHS repeat-associated protein
VCGLDGGGNVVAVNTFGAQGLVSRHVTSTNASTFYTFDERGNVAQRTDGAGAVLSSDLYDAYGKRLSGGANGDPCGFEAQAGYYTDGETGLVLCTHRYYDPQTGRFVTRDPIGYGGGINLYGYTVDNPVNEDDPNGLDPYAQGQKFLVHGQKGNYIINVPVGQDINRNVQEAQVFYGQGSGPDIDLMNLNGLPHSRRANYLGCHTANYTIGDYKDIPEFIDKNIDHELWHERDLGGNFNLGAMGNAMGFHLLYLLDAGDILHRQHTTWTEPHPADLQQAIIDGFNWYTKHYGSQH